MTSVTSFMRQVPLSTTYYNAQGVMTSASTCAFEFVPDGSNYVGNYPPGYMVAGGVGSALATAIAAAKLAAGSYYYSMVLRDMGKTIYAPVGASTSPDTRQYAFFREVQLITPTYNSATGAAGHSLIGGPNGTTFGVGVCLTFYVAATVAGVGLPLAGCADVYPVAGGQM